MVEWRNPPGSSRVVFIPFDRGHPPFQRGVVDYFWMDPSFILGSTVQPHTMALVLKWLDAPPKEDLQKVHTRHSFPN